MNFLKSVFERLKDPVFLVSVIIVVFVTSIFILPFVLTKWAALRAKQSAALILGLLTLALASGSAHAASAGGLAPAWNDAQVCWAILGVGVVALGFAWLSKFIKARAGAFIAVFAIGLCAVLAAPNIADKFTTLIVRPDSRAHSSATNGLFRLYSPNGSNYMMIATNGQLVFFTGIGFVTGYNGAIMATNADGAVRSNTVFNGFIVATNGQAPITPK